MRLSRDNLTCIQTYVVEYHDVVKIFSPNETENPPDLQDVWSTRALSLVHLLNSGAISAAICEHVGDLRALAAVCMGIRDSVVLYM